MIWWLKSGYGFATPLLIIKGPNLTNRSLPGLECGTFLERVVCFHVALLSQ